MAALPERMIAEQRTAAWVLGAIDFLPQRLQLCTDIAARARSASLATITVREVVIEASEFTWIAGLRVTTPLRTALDLARFSEGFEDDERTIVAKLAQLGGFGLADCTDAIDGRRNLPRKHQAVERLSAALAS